MYFSWFLYLLYLIIPPQIFMKYIPKPEYHADLFSMIIKVSTDSMLKDYCTLHFSELLKKKKGKKLLTIYTNSKDWFLTWCY